MTKETLKVVEAAQVLGIGTWLTREGIRRGQIPAIRIGRRLLIPRAALEEMLKGKTETPPVKAAI
jgi:excisionase family DNA binding protein